MGMGWKCRMGYRGGRIRRIRMARRGLMGRDSICSLSSLCPLDFLCAAHSGYPSSLLYTHFRFRMRFPLLHPYTPKHHHSTPCLFLSYAMDPLAKPINPINHIPQSLCIYNQAILPPLLHPLRSSYKLFLFLPVVAQWISFVFICTILYFFSCCNF